MTKAKAKAEKNSFCKRTMIEVFCSKCGERYNDNSEYESLFQDKKEAVEIITDDFWTVKGNEAYCEDCSQYLTTPQEGEEK